MMDISLSLSHTQRHTHTQSMSIKKYSVCFLRDSIKKTLGLICPKFHILLLSTVYSSVSFFSPLFPSSSSLFTLYLLNYLSFLHPFSVFVNSFLPFPVSFSFLSFRPKLLLSHSFCVLLTCNPNPNPKN